MNERMQRILADLKARQEAGEHMACPRCGCDRRTSWSATTAA